MNAVIYIRVSSTSQLDGDGPERQRSACLKFAAEAGYTIIHIFVEDLSGTKDAKSRDVFLEMLEFCQQHNVNTVIIEKSDRIARDMFVGLSIIGDCAKANLHLIDADTTRDISHPTGPYEKFVVQILMAAAELNKNVLVHQTRKARERKRATGHKCEGAKGYFDHPDYPRGQELKQRITELYHRPLREIADTLTREGFPTLKGATTWAPSSVSELKKKVA